MANGSTLEGGIGMVRSYPCVLKKGHKVADDMCAVSFFGERLEGQVRGVVTRSRSAPLKGMYRLRLADGCGAVISVHPAVGTREQQLRVIRVLSLGE